MSSGARGHCPAKAGRLTRALLAAGCGALVVGTTACESTEQESARIGKANEASAAAEAPKALVLGRRNHSVEVSHLTLLHGEGSQAVVAALITSRSPRAQAQVPLALNVTSGSGKVLYTNRTAGLEPALQRLGSLPAHGHVWWVDDQVTLTAAGSPRITVGTGTQPRAGRGSLATSGLKISQKSGPSELVGTVVNHTGRAQKNVAVFAVALKGGKVVAAGRALVVSVPAKGSPPKFQIFLVGHAAGATLQADAVASGG